MCTKVLRDILWFYARLLSLVEMQISNVNCGDIYVKRWIQEARNKTKQITKQKNIFILWCVFFCLGFYHTWECPFKPIYYHVFVWNFTMCPTSFIMLWLFFFILVCMYRFVLLVYLVITRNLLCSSLSVVCAHFHWLFCWFLNALFKIVEF